MMSVADYDSMLLTMYGSILSSQEVSLLLTHPATALLGNGNPAVAPSHNVLVQF